MEANGNKKVNAIYEANLGDTTKINRSSSKYDLCFKHVLKEYPNNR